MKEKHDQVEKIGCSRVFVCLQSKNRLNMLIDLGYSLFIFLKQKTFN
jgi:hypothetical protein